MAQAASSPTVKMICGMISSRPELFDLAAERLIERFGPADLSSEVLSFDFTHYYDEEMGSPLLRKFVAFERLVAPGILVEAKCLTNELESAFAAERPEGPARPINLDPGYLESSKLVLASMKNFAHRMYIDRGVYGEVTLQFCRGAWMSMSYTFPDYASPRYHPFLTAVRDRLREQLAAGPEFREPSS